MKLFKPAFSFIYYWFSVFIHTPQKRLLCDVCPQVVSATLSYKTQHCQGQRYYCNPQSGLMGVGGIQRERRKEGTRLKTKDRHGPELYVR